MKEYIVTMNAQITFILKDNDTFTEESIRETTEKIMANSIKEDLQADDVVVSDMKLFVLDKKESNDGKDE